MKISALLALTTTLFFAACTEPPKEASEMSDTQSERVDEIIHRAKAMTPFVKRIVAAADPLPGLEGGRNGNADLPEQLDGLVNDLKEIQSAGRVLIVPIDYSGEGVEASAYGAGTVLHEGDNYILIRVGENGSLNIAPGDLMHETAHYFAGFHSPEMVTYLDSISGTVVEPSELLRKSIELGDAPYPIGFIYHATGDLFKINSQKFFEGGTNPFFQSEGPDEIQTRIDELQSELSKYDTIEKWAMEAVEIDSDDGFDEGKLFETIGVTNAELQDILKESTEMYSTWKENTENGINIYRERLHELQSEAGLESQRGRR